MTCGISSKDINLPSCSSTGANSNLNIGTNESDEDNNDKNIELTDLLQKTKKNLNPMPWLIHNKRKYLEWQLSLPERDQLRMNKSKEEALFRKDLTDAIRESNETFTRSLN